MSRNVNVAEQQRAAALGVSAPVRQANQERIRDYIAKSGLHIEDFARLVGYGGSTMRLYMADRYERVAGNDTYIVQATDDWMARHPVGTTSAISGTLYQTAAVRLIDSTIQQLLKRPRALMIYAPPGMQKSFVLEHTIQQVNLAELPKNGKGRRVYYVYVREKIMPQDLMKRIAVACGVNSTGSIDRILRNLQVTFANRRVLLVFDEAQHLSIPCFEIIRELLDRPPNMSLLFAGSHTLKETFDHFSATLEQCNSRVGEKIRLPGLTTEEAGQIIAGELGELLSRKGATKAQQLTDRMVQQATVKDHYSKGATYINIRTLCESIAQVKDKATQGVA